MPHPSHQFAGSSMPAFSPPPALNSRLDCRLTFLVYEFLVRFAAVVEPWRKAPISIDQFEEAFSLSHSQIALGAQVSARHAKEYVTYLINISQPLKLARSSSNEEAEKSRWESRVYNSISDLVKEGYLEENPYQNDSVLFFEMSCNARMEVLYALTCRALQSTAIRDHMQLNRSLSRTTPVGYDSNKTDYYLLAGTERIYAVTTNNNWSLVSLGPDDVESLLERFRSSTSIINDNLSRMLSFELACRAADARAAAAIKEKPKDPVFRALRNLGIDLDVAVSFQNINRTRSQTTQSSSTTSSNARAQSNSSSSNSNAAVSSRPSSVNSANTDDNSMAVSTIPQAPSKLPIGSRRRRVTKDPESLLRQYKISLGIPSKGSSSSLNQSTSSNSSTSSSSSTSVDAFQKLFDGSRNQATLPPKKAPASSRKKRLRSESPPAKNRVSLVSKLNSTHDENDLSRESTSSETDQNEKSSPIRSNSKDHQAHLVPSSPVAKKFKSANEIPNSSKAPLGPFARMMAYLQRKPEKLASAN